MYRAFAAIFITQVYRIELTALELPVQPMEAAVQNHAV